MSKNAAKRPPAKQRAGKGVKQDGKRRTGIGRDGDSAALPFILSGESVLDYLRSVHKPRALDDILRELRIPRRSKKDVQDILHGLEEAGALSRLSGGSYVPAASLKRLSGMLELRGGGSAVVRPDSDRRGDVLISPGNMGRAELGAWQGDRVLVALFPDRRGREREGRILEILEEGSRELAVRVLRSLGDGSALCEALDGRMAATFITDLSDVTGLAGATPARGDILRVRVTACESPGLWRARAMVFLGDEDSLAVQEDIVKAAHGIPTVFPAAALEEAAAFGPEPDCTGISAQGRGQSRAGARKDCTDIHFVTIDGESARDFDDAIHVERDGDGFRLRVAIADVAHYVRPGSALDAEAFRRGNSCYFPLSVEPMLPEALSNGLCSLNPGVPRLGMVAELACNSAGEVGRTRFYPALIRSRARLTYTQIRESLIDGVADAGETLGESLPMLHDALALARLMAERRSGRGSLDFDMPEAHYVFGEDGTLLAIEPARGSFANRLIEEFMVAANEAVARYLTEREYPLLYRVHPAPDPDKLGNLFKVVQITGMSGALGLRIPARPSAGNLRALLEAVKGTDQEYLVGRLVLRSMMQAGYDPALEPHFGLASACYCHFTSPIRRYADLVVHRSLKAALGAEDATPIPDKRKLARAAEHLRETERAAMDAERDIARRLGALFMRDKVGDIVEGVISGVTDFGIFVEFDTIMAEGMIRLSSLGDDYYTFNPERQELRGQRGGKAYRLGMKARVRVVDVNPSRQEITLAFASPDGAGDDWAAAPDPGRGRGGRFGATRGRGAFGAIPPSGRGPKRGPSGGKAGGASSGKSAKNGKGGKGRGTAKKSSSRRAR